MPAREIPVSDAAGFIADGGVVLDVREHAEVVGGSVPGARHIPLGELVERLAELDRDVPIACLCRSGARSQVAADYLADHGFDAANLAGGMIGWPGDVAPID